LHGILKTSVEIFPHEVNRGAAFVFVVVEPGVTANRYMSAGPFQLRAGASQCFAAGFEEGGEVGVLGGV